MRILKHAWRLSWLLAVSLVAASCDPAAAPITMASPGLCWPHESAAAYDEYIAMCKSNGSGCPATTAWRKRLLLLAVQIPGCP